MSFALVLYYSRYGQTKALANYIATGIESAKIEARIRTVPEVSTVITTAEPAVPNTGDPYVTLEDLEGCCALALGSPTRFGNMAAPLKHFIDQTTKIWFSGGLVGKPATVFSSTSSMHGGQETTLLSMMLPLLHHGAIIVGTPYTESALTATKTGGTPYGVTHVAGVNNDNAISDDEKYLAIATGKRLGELAQKLIA